MEDISRLGMQFGQYVQQVTFDLLTTTCEPTAHRVEFTDSSSRPFCTLTTDSSS